MLIKTTDKNGADINFRYGKIKECKVIMDLYDTMNIEGVTRYIAKPEPNVNISFKFSEGEVQVREPSKFERICKKFGLIR